LLIASEYYTAVAEDAGNRSTIGSVADRLAGSPLAEALARVGDRWTLLVVAALLDGPRRFGDLQQELEGIAPNVLSQRLRHLEAQGLVLARRYSERPPRFAYELSASAEELAGALRLLADWGARHGDEADPPRHADCGTALEARWYCPACEQVVEDGGADDVHHA
jgi:DNA-binding HxlR family transcriptional regulator